MPKKRKPPKQYKPFELLIPDYDPKPENNNGYHGIIPAKYSACGTAELIRRNFNNPGALRFIADMADGEWLASILLRCANKPVAVPSIAELFLERCEREARL